MQLSPGLLLLLLRHLQAVADIPEEEVQAMVGSDVELGCTVPEGGSFDLSKLYVYWQISESETVVMYHIPGNSSTGHVNPHYRNRAHLSPDRMKRGDFSLHLFNITPQDEQKFHCLVFWNFKEVLKAVVTLHVAANYSMPVVTPPSSPSQDELVFTCTSTNGYPRPNVYWINKTDNTLLDEALQNSTVSLNPRGLYDVVSVLRIEWSPSVNVGCCIENVLLHQNLTVSSQPETLTGTQDKITENQIGTSCAAVSSTLFVAAVALAAGWVCRDRWQCRCLRRHYAGAQAARPELELTDHV